MLRSLFLTQLILTTFAILANAATYQTDAPRRDDTMYSVTVESQPDSPLQITFVRNQAVVSTELNFTATLENRGDRPIRAYTIRYKSACGDTANTLGGAGSSSRPFHGVVLRPGECGTFDVSEQWCDDPFLFVALSVDFIEFEGGTTWGQDMYKFAEGLAGQRAGTDAVLAFLATDSALQVKKSPVSTLDRAELLTPEQDGTEKWKAGFHTGVVVAARQLKNAYEHGGWQEYQHTLQQASGTFSEP